MAVTPVSPVSLSGVALPSLALSGFGAYALLGLDDLAGLDADLVGSGVVTVGFLGLTLVGLLWAARGRGAVRDLTATRPAAARRR